MDEQGSHF